MTSIPHITTRIPFANRIQLYAYLAALTFAGCGDSDASSTTNQDAGNPAPVCSKPSGSACSCPNNAVGAFNCDLQGGSCTCPTLNVCRNFKSDADEKFVACGGAPFGLWKVKNVTPLRMMFTIIQAIGTRESICPVLSLPQGLAADGFFEFKEGGLLRGSIELKGTVTAKRECAVGTARGLVCSDLSVCKSTTNAEGCDLCECTTSRGATFPAGATWARNATTITIDHGGFNSAQAVFDYCVTGPNALLLNDISSGPKNSTLVFTLERVTRSGVPLACQSRNADTCIKGSGCQVGQCTGSGSCATAKTEGSCLTFQNCTWNAKSCAGTATATCGEDDYDVVPGCKFVPPL